jgi:hypothetical protein
MALGYIDEMKNDDIKPGDDLGNGLVAVPREPTPRMIEMARTCLKRLPEEAQVVMTFGSWRESHDLKMRARWTAMLEAAKPVELNREPLTPEQLKRFIAIAEQRGWRTA